MDSCAKSPQSPIYLEVPSDNERDTIPESVIRSFSHNRRCDKREPCSCYLRAQSAHFLADLHRKCKRHATTRLVSKGRAVIKNLQLLELDMKALITTFLTPVDLAILSMVSKQWRHEVDTIAEKKMIAFVTDETRKDHVIHESKRKDESWSRYMHKQFTCVHKLFVYYTGYKTAAMRRQTPHWAFGFVYVDPNDPSKVILPNEWKFHDHIPWLPRRGNGKDGEWRLKRTYQHDRAPKRFVSQVREWAGTIRPGSHIAVAFQQPGSDETTWWEAQVWYVWRAGERQDMARVLNPLTGKRIQVSPNDLETYFRENPTHVIDVCTVPGALCIPCTRRVDLRGAKISFYQCHVEQGHPML